MTTVAARLAARDAARAAALPPVVPHPNICTLAGPTKHYLSFDAASLRLGKLGWLVFSVGSHRADDAGRKTTEAELRTYYRTHRAKIALSSLVYVVDLPTPDSDPVAEARIGYDTTIELDYAAQRRVPIVRMSETWPDGVARLRPPAVEIPPPIDPEAGWLSAVAATAAGGGGSGGSSLPS